MDGKLWEVNSLGGLKFLVSCHIKWEIRPGKQGYVPYEMRTAKTPLMSV